MALSNSDGNRARFHRWESRAAHPCAIAFKSGCFTWSLPNRQIGPRTSPAAWPLWHRYAWPTRRRRPLATTAEAGRGRRPSARSARPCMSPCKRGAELARWRWPARAGRAGNRCADPPRRPPSAVPTWCRLGQAAHVACRRGAGVAHCTGAGQLDAGSAGDRHADPPWRPPPAAPTWCRTPAASLLQK